MDPKKSKRLNATSKGQFTEQLALKYLLRQGFKELQRNYVCLLGELDIIGFHSQALIFVEVRYRRYLNYGHAIETINAQKKINIIRTAKFFLKCHPKLQNFPCRFDVLALQGDIRKPQIIWVKNAF